MSELNQKLFNLILSDFQIDVRSGGNENEEIARVSELAKDADVNYLTRVLDSIGFYPVKSNEETASFGILQFSTYTDYTDMEKALETEDDDNESNSEDTAGQDDGHNGRRTEHGGRFELSNMVIDGDGKDLRVLVDIDSHKFADKLYTQTLGNDEDRKTYAAFLYAFDNFLFLYKNQEAREDEPEEASVKSNKVFLNTFIDKFSAFIPQGTPENAGAETAKEKSARSQVLKALMKLMSGKHGLTLVSAWESGDVDKAADAMGNIMEGILNQMPEPDDSDETEEDEDTDGGDEDTSDGGEDTSEPVVKEAPADVPADLTLSK
jgi:hypothetical protein